MNDEVASDIEQVNLVGRRLIIILILTDIVASMIVFYDYFFEIIMIKFYCGNMRVMI